MRSSLKKILIFLSLFGLLSTLQAPAHAKNTFYLDLKKGCYSGNSPASDLLEWSLPGYKKLYRTTCYQKYHYQVYYVSKLTTRLTNNDASQAQAREKCSSAAARAIGNKYVDEYLNLGWFFPDAGVEEAKYGKKLICFFRIEDRFDQYMTVAQFKPMV
jgi:hypothetical protein